MPTLDNPAEKLASIVSMLYDYAGRSDVPSAQRQQLLLLAHDLRGDLVSLVSVQFTQETDAYKTAMDALADVSEALQAANDKVDEIVKTVSDVATLAKSLDALLKEAAKLAVM